MRHLTTSRGWRGLLAASAVLLALGGLTAPASALPEDAVPASASAACGQPAGLGTGNHTITSGGQSRTFRLDVPAGYDPNRPYRLVVGLHWWHGTSQDVVNQGFYGLKPLASESTVFVAPQGFDNAWPNSNGQDVAFVDDVLRTVESALCIDTTQRFATGFSYGGGMSNALACARADVFRAVAVLNGAQLSGCAGGTQPVAYLGSHGVVDSVLNISQGRALRDRFLQNNGCQAQQAPEPAAGSGMHIKTTYTCRDGFPVVWIANDSDHQWDARDRGQSQSHVPGEIWQFFTSLTGTTPTPTGACTATYRTVNSWPGGFQGEVTVRAGDASTTSWSVTWSPSGERVDQVWNGTATAQDDLVVVRNSASNGTLAAGGTTTFGLLGSGTPPTPALTCASS
jgi:poly(3-hydroxybutyrate) depolymerase